MFARGLRQLLFVAALVALPLPALAQATWEDAPAEGPSEISADEAPESEASVAPAANAPVADRDPSALTDFNAALAPYGHWRDDPTYGRVWVPNKLAVGADFAPYVTSGHWAVAEDGQWLWVSDYPFGWVVFHYGRWVWIRGVGWSWIPGREYAPAWVVWRVPEPGVYYVGWAPMPPDYLWWDGVAVGIWFGVYTPWVFCPSAYVYSHHVHTYIVHDHHHVHSIAAHTHHYHPPKGSPPYYGPSHKVARIPAKAVPKHRTAANPKAIAASRPSSAQRIGPQPAPHRPRPSGTARPIRSSRSLGSVPGASRPAPSRPAPSHRAAPSYRPAPSRAAPSYHRPAPRAAPRYRSAPARAAPKYRSAPSRSAPSHSSSPSRAAPSYRSAPRAAPPPQYHPKAPSRAAPSRSAPRGRRR